MSKKIIQLIKLQIPAGKANPAPPVGPALGQHGLNIQDFCSQFNEKTKEMGDTVVPVVINVFDDKSFNFIMKTAPAAEMIKKAINLKKGSGVPHKEKVGVLPKNKLKEIAEKKMDDLNANDIDMAMRVIAGTARSMGVTIEE